MSFSEFSYGHAVVREFELLLSRDGLRVPTFPSLRDERNLGYDVAVESIKRSWFLQFKRSEEISGPRARLRGILSRPYFRFPVTPRRKSPQHDKLVELAARIQPEGHEVAYCAPGFVLQTSLASHYASKSVLMNSIYVDLASEPMLPDDNLHCYNFDQGFNRTIFTSEEMRDVQSATSIWAMLQPSTPHAVLSKAETLDSLFSLKRHLLKTYWQLTAEEGLHSEHFLSDQDQSPGMLMRSIYEIAELGLGLSWLPAFGRFSSLA